MCFVLSNPARIHSVVKQAYFLPIQRLRGNYSSATLWHFAPSVPAPGSRQYSASIPADRHLSAPEGFETTLNYVAITLMLPIEIWRVSAVEILHSFGQGWRIGFNQ
jgi:hypothetical protein